MAQYLSMRIMTMGSLPQDRNNVRKKIPRSNAIATTLQARSDDASSRGEKPPRGQSGHPKTTKVR